MVSLTSGVATYAYCAQHSLPRTLELLPVLFTDALLHLMACESAASGERQPNEIAFLQVQLSLSACSSCRAAA